MGYFKSSLTFEFDDFMFYSLKKTIISYIPIQMDLVRLKLKYREWVIKFFWCFSNNKKYYLFWKILNKSENEIVFWGTHPAPNPSIALKYVYTTVTVHILLLKCVEI